MSCSLNRFLLCIKATYQKLVWNSLCSSGYKLILYVAHSLIPISLPPNPKYNVYHLGWLHQPFLMYASTHTSFQFLLPIDIDWKNSKEIPYSFFRHWYLDSEMILGHKVPFSMVVMETLLGRKHSWLACCHGSTRKQRTEKPCFDFFHQN